MITKCEKCKKEFEDINYKKKYKSAKRIYCNECVNEFWEDKIEMKGGKKLC